MRFKITILCVVLLNCLQIVGMAEDKEQLIQGWHSLPDEVMIYVISFAGKCYTTSQTLAQLATLSCIDKRFSRLASDRSLKKFLISLHVNDDDYQEVLSKMLLRAARINSCSTLEILSEVPRSSKSSTKNLVVTILSGNDDEGLEPGTEFDGKEESFIEANVNTPDCFGYAPLLYAAERGYTKVVQVLLNKGAYIAVKNKDNDTALILAAKKGHIKIVKKLLFYEEVKNSINARGFGGDTAFLCVAKQCIYVSGKAKDNYLTLLKLLAEHGADVNASDPADLSAMDWAAKEGKARLVSFLLDLKAHLTKENKSRLEVFAFGVASNKEIVEVLEKIKGLEEVALEISEVRLQLKNEPYTLSFKIGPKVYKTEVNNVSVNLEFNDKISAVNDETLHQIGNLIVQEVIDGGVLPGSIIKNGSYDLNDYRLALQFIFGQSLYEPYFHAEQGADLTSMKKIREIVKPIFKAYPDKTNSIYGNNLKKYEIEI